MTQGPGRRADRSAILEFVLVVPALLFVVSNGLAYNLHVRRLIPVAAAFVPRPIVLQALILAVVLLGPLVALVLSLRSILSVRVRHQGSTLIGHVVLRLHAGHLAVSLLSLAILGAIGGYLLLENLPCLTGVLVTC